MEGEFALAPYSVTEHCACITAIIISAPVSWPTVSDLMFRRQSGRQFPQQRLFSCDKSSWRVPDVCGGVWRFVEVSGGN